MTMEEARASIGGMEMRLVIFHEFYGAGEMSMSKEATQKELKQISTSCSLGRE